MSLQINVELIKNDQMYERKKLLQNLTERSWIYRIYSYDDVKRVRFIKEYRTWFLLREIYKLLGVVDKR